MPTPMLDLGESSVSGIMFRVSYITNSTSSASATIKSGHRISLGAKVATDNDIKVQAKIILTAITIRNTATITNSITI